jgi:NAD(P)-dependent dehydrogenase (short-subunit alcohol dehydrogenase family)
MLSNRHAFITGGSEGMGLETAKLLLQRPFCLRAITIFARTESKLLDARNALALAAKAAGREVDTSGEIIRAKELAVPLADDAPAAQGAGGAVGVYAQGMDRASTAGAGASAGAGGSQSSLAIVLVSGDVGSFASVDAGLLAAAKAGGCEVDILIAAAGMSKPMHFEELTDSDFERCMRVNYFGVVNSAMAFFGGNGKRARASSASSASGPRFEKHFVAVASLVVAMPFSGFAAYAPSKVAVQVGSARARVFHRPELIRRA